MSVHHVINQRVEGSDKQAKIESSHLHITANNKTFLNEEGAEFKHTGTLIVDASPTAPTSFTNWGTMKLGEVKINREATNEGFWQADKMTVAEKSFTNKETLKILDEIIVTSYLSNEGDMTVKKSLKTHQRPKHWQT